MNNVKLLDESVFFGPPKGWDEEKDGPCMTISVANVNVDGRNMMTTAWEFTPEEIAAFAKGARFFIGISGHTNNGFPLLTMAVSD